MKFDIRSKYFLLTMSLLLFLSLTFIEIYFQINPLKERTSLTYSEIKVINSNLEKIVSPENRVDPKSSNPYEQIKANKMEYDKIIQIGDPVVDFFVSEFKNGNLNDTNYWITAWISNEILGDRNPVKIWSEDNSNGWSSGKDWFQKYIKIETSHTLFEKVKLISIFAIIIIVYCIIYFYQKFKFDSKK